MQIEAEKKRSCLPSMGRFISVFEVSKREMNFPFPVWVLHQNDLCQ